MSYPIYYQSTEKQSLHSIVKLEEKNEDGRFIHSCNVLHVSPSVYISGQIFIAFFMDTQQPQKKSHCRVAPLQPLIVQTS